MRHRGPAQRRQVHPLQRADQGRHRRGELSLLHDRAERGHRRGARSAAAAAGGHRQARAHRAGDRRVRRHRRAGGRRQQGRGPGQPVPGPHPRDRRDRQRGALLRGRERHPRGRQGGPDQPTSRSSRPSCAWPTWARWKRACCATQKVAKAGQRQGSAAPGRGAEEVPGRAGPGAAGAQHRLQQGRTGGAQAAVPDHRQAGDVRRQRGRGWLREQPLPRPAARLWRQRSSAGGGDLRQDRGRAGRHGPKTTGCCSCTRWDWRSRG